MRIVELTIDMMDELAGFVDAISLVEKPAHESNWLAFKDEKKRNIYDVLTKEELIELAIELNKLGEPAGTLEAEGWGIEKIEKISDPNHFIEVISNPNEVSGEDSELAYRIRYRYTGPQDSKNRDFCAEMLRQGRVFRREDIDDMTSAMSNPEFGFYSIWEFRGSYNCRHYWQKLTYRWEGNIINKSRSRRGVTGYEDIPNTPTKNDATINKEAERAAEAQANRISTSMIEFGVVDIVDDMPVFSTKEDALKMGKAIGCSGYHEYEGGFMACEKHGMKVEEPAGSDLGGQGLAPYVDETGTEPLTGVTGNTQFSFKADDDKMEITGAAIIPNKMIIRKSPPTFEKPNGEFYWVFFSEETTRKLADRFMKAKLLDASNIEHSDKDADSYVKESWIVEDPIFDKSTAMGLEYPKGTWVVTMKVNDSKVWKDIKNGKLNGYSIEGWFNETVLFN